LDNFYIRFLDNKSNELGKTNSGTLMIDNLEAKTEYKIAFEEI
jgi:hypothetical protein